MDAGSEKESDAADGSKYAEGAGLGLAVGILLAAVSLAVLSVAGDADAGFVAIQRPVTGTVLVFSSVGILWAAAAVVLGERFGRAAELAATVTAFLGVAAIFLTSYVNGTLTFHGAAASSGLGLAVIGTWVAITGLAVILLGALEVSGRPSLLTLTCVALIPVAIVLITVRPWVTDGYSDDDNTDALGKAPITVVAVQ